MFGMFGIQLSVSDCSWFVLAKRSAFNGCGLHETRPCVDRTSPFPRPTSSVIVCRFTSGVCTCGSTGAVGTCGSGPGFRSPTPPTKISSPKLWSSTPSPCGPLRFHRCSLHLWKRSRFSVAHPPAFGPAGWRELTGGPSGVEVLFWVSALL